LKAWSRLWDATIIPVIAFVASIALFDSRDSASPVPTALVIGFCILILCLAYIPRDGRREAASFERRVRAGGHAFDASIVVLLALSAVFGCVDDQVKNLGQVLTVVALLVGVGLAYVVLLRPMMPWLEPVRLWRWWLFIGVSTLSLAGLGYLASSAAISQVVVFGILWVSVSERIGLALPVVATACVTIGTGIGLVLSRGWIDAIAIEAAGIAFSMVGGTWIWSAWRWGMQKALLLSALQQTQASLAAVEQEVAVLAERERISREIHDTVAQSLAGVLFGVERAVKQASAPVNGSPQVAQQLGTVIESARQALREARGIVAVGSKLDRSEPFDQVIERLAGRFSQETGIHIETHVDLPRTLSPEAGLVLLRATQEGLANLRKHSQASCGWITIKSPGDAVVLEVADDGVGPSQGSGGFGLPGLRDRVATLGGSVQLTPRPGGGTTLKVHLDNPGFQHPNPNP
jgi:signal transduction histidine kinase